MKKSHILGIVVIAIAIGIIMSTAGDASSYVTFNEAKAMASSGNDAKIHVVGTLKKSSDGTVEGIEPAGDKLSFSFLMVDAEMREQQVYYPEPMPVDFLRSEQVVVIGAYHDELFIADKILLKCPSKYQEEEIRVTS
ncbi:MAG: cytochrome C biogenesis protein CcmE [Cyclobacteriaceae bacterium]|nr:MAG: cytochrome C biogenesis protein CcmE [Cyclobacteriaceae bacterium]